MDTWFWEVASNMWNSKNLIRGRINYFVTAKLDKQPDWYLFAVSSTIILWTSVGSFRLITCTHSCWKRNIFIMRSHTLIYDLDVRIWLREGQAEWTSMPDIWVRGHVFSKLLSGCTRHTLHTPNRVRYLDHFSGTRPLWLTWVDLVPWRCWLMSNLLSKV